MTEAGIIDRSIRPVFVPDCSRPNCDTGANEAEDMFAAKSAEPVPTEEENQPFAGYKFDVDNGSRRSLKEVFG
jgi:hypothetical protein